MWGKGLKFETYVTLERDFPRYDQDLEQSITYFTDLALACDCAVLGLEDADRTLTEVIARKAEHLSQYRSADGRFLGSVKDEPINVDAALGRIESAIREILAFERNRDCMKDVDAKRDDAPERDDARRAAIEAFLATKDPEIKSLLHSRVRPVIEQVAKAWLPDASLLAASYFMARAVLWRISPEFMKKHHESLCEQSKELPLPKVPGAPIDGHNFWNPSIFLDVKGLGSYGYRTPSVKLARIIAGIDPWPEAPKPADVIPMRAQATPPAPSSPMGKLASAMRSLKDAVLPAGAEIGKPKRSADVEQIRDPKRPGTR